MSIELLSLLFFGALLVFLILGLPLSFVLGGVSMIFIYFTWGPEAFYMVAAQTWGAMNKFTLVAVPLFIFMAMILERSGVAKGLYEMMYLWFGPVAGGLAIGTVVICAIFSAMCGISGAAVVSMGTIALPSMLERNYDKELALGCINSGGGLVFVVNTVNRGCFFLAEMFFFRPGPGRRVLYLWALTGFDRRPVSFYLKIAFARGQLPYPFPGGDQVGFYQLSIRSNPIYLY